MSLTSSLGSREEEEKLQLENKNNWLLNYNSTSNILSNSFNLIINNSKFNSFLKEELVEVEENCKLFLFPFLHIKIISHSTFVVFIIFIFYFFS